MKNLYPIVVLICALSLMSFTSIESNDIKEKVNIINYSTLDFNKIGGIETLDFATATCSEIRGGIKYTTTVGCFLCGEERAADRCERVLSRRLDELNPGYNR